MNRRTRIPWWAEVPLVAVSAATVFGFSRLYIGWGFLTDLLAFALGAHAAAIACRRLRIPGPLVVLTAVVGAGIAVGWILFPDTTMAGLPTTATWHAATDSLGIAREQYPVVIAPTEVLPGFQLAAGLALWLAAWFGDWAAHRLRATAEAVAATTAIFIFCSVLGSGRGEVICSAVFAGAVLVFVAVQRSVALERDHSWLPDHRATSRAVLRSAGVVAVLALGAGVLIGPAFPGARSEAAISWRGNRPGDRSRVTVSPMVEIRKRLVDQSDREVFRVRSTAPAYWRLTSLDTFDGDIWSSSGEFKQAGDELPTTAPRAEDFRPVTQEVTIVALSTIWAPTAFEAVSVTATETPLRWDPDSSTLIVDASEPTSDGLRYSVVSKVPQFGPEQLEADAGEDPAAVQDRYLGLPSDFPFAASDLARRVTDQAATRYEVALALQDWFRSEFTYSLDPDDGHGDQAVEQFLRSKEGYCEQFAGTFAAMARSLGIPARVAVGFTPGDTDPEDPDLYRVLGRHAHAWPEVYFPGTGWVAFEPTPGRGMPGAEEYSGVRAQQDTTSPASEATTSTTTVATTATPSSESSPTTQPPQTERTETAAPDAETDDRDDRSGVWPLVIVAALALAAAALVIRRRRAGARRRAALTDADRAWERVTAALARSRGIDADPALTPVEVAEAAASAVGPAADALARLAELVTTARWSAEGLDEADTAEVDRLAEEVLTAVRTREPAAV
ncbi:transglutaminaseTgpA domain-containing protein [Aquihabitans daechungensis]|uniref:transglutaminase family protein n=1 Tax=Aquihabitans daechungensis TaxID=1052257 RepID=UPI003BA2E881